MPLYGSQLPFVEGDIIELTHLSRTYRGKVNRITPSFTTLHHGPNNNYETILANSAILSGNFVIIKKVSDTNNAVAS
jgi:hypothetical protein